MVLLWGQLVLNPMPYAEREYLLVFAFLAPLSVRSPRGVRRSSSRLGVGLLFTGFVFCFVARGIPVWRVVTIWRLEVQSIR